jgi:predicted phosphodiesterase
MSRLIVVGDVHGCIEELKELVEKLELKSDDTVIFAGDLVHKGPDSAGVVRLVMSLRTAVRELVLVRGNHEETALKKRDVLLTEDQWAFLKSAPLWWRDASRNLLVTHGGIPKGLDALPEDPHSVEKLSNSKRKLFDRLCRMRYVDAKTGDFVALTARQPGDPFWALTYDGRLGHVIFGHEPFHTRREPVEFDHATGVDLGCVQGGKLCALVIERLPEKFSAPFRNLLRSTISVSARDMYVPPLDVD